MWDLPALERDTVELDFTSSGLGRRRVTRLVAGSVVFANAIELTDWGARDVQVVVCEHCGIVLCQPGGWLGPRRAGDYVVFAPDSRLLQGDELDRAEYQPPEYVREFGWPFTMRTGYEELRASVPGLPVHDRLRALTRRDVVAIGQWEAPAAVLGRPFEHPALHRDLLLAASGDLDQLSAALTECLASWAASDAPVVLERVATAPEIFVDVPRAPAWRPLANVDGWSLCVAPDLVARGGK
jgi:hypothetical protein